MSVFLAYVSSATRLLTRDELGELLEESRVANAAAGITGALLYQDGNFMQIIEADDDRRIDDLYARISADDRHDDVNVLLRRQTDERQFTDWSMAFRDLSGDGSELAEGFSDFFQHRYDQAYFGDQPNAGQRLLLAFRRTLNPAR